jgi:hypothetical protein
MCTLFVPRMEKAGKASLTGICLCKADRQRESTAQCRILGKNWTDKSKNCA